jgi:serine/threonine-protein kinase
MSEVLRFGRYEAFEELGSGAMGKVYLAVDPLIDRMVAVKVIRTDLLAPEERGEFLERFRLEVRAAARCAHPNIVAVHDFADHAAMPNIVMEHVPGRTLSAILRGDPEERRAALPGLVQAMFGVLEGLKAAHALGVIHRDIKPGNIMITPRGQVKITDFGIAKFGGGELTQLGGVVGTPAYMAPEQAHGHKVDPRSDLFSVAAILFEILFGRAPFAGNNMTDTLMRLTGPAPAELGSLASTPLGEVLRQGLAKDPAERFADAADFAAVLGAALAPVAAPNPAPPPSPQPRSAPPPLARTIPAGPPPLTRHAPPTLPPPRPVAPPSPPAAPSQTEGGFALSPAQVAGAITALAFIVGPIARLLVGKATAQAGNRAEFVALLCAHAEGPERAALRPRLEALF